MSGPRLIEDLARSLRDSRRLAALPLLLGLIPAAALIAFDRQMVLWSLGFLAAGAAVSAALTWWQALALDLQFLPQLVQLRGIETGSHSPAPPKLLPDGIVPMGTQRIMLNMVAGEVSGQKWQAGFLECSRRDLNTGSTKAEFLGQVVQLQLMGMTPGFVLRPKPPGLSHRSRLGDLYLPEAAEFSVKGTGWVLHMTDHLAARSVSLRCKAVLEGLPAPPKGARLLGLVSAEGWLQLICANRRDLFSLWHGLFQIATPRAILQRVFTALCWAELSALALAGFEEKPPENSQS